MLLLPIIITVIKICLADNREILECEWIICLLPKVCQRFNGIISCVLPDDAMKRKVEISSDSLSSANQITPITESIFTESLIAHSSPIPHLSALSLSISKMGSFPSSETVTEQGPLLFSPKTSEENFTVKILPQICLLPALTGPCSKTKVLWYYNSLTGRCERFSFSGCGNANHFRTRKECEETCSVEYFI